jgi:hypothetical protein
MKEIKIKKGIVTQVDDEDFEYLNQFQWFNHYGYVVRMEKINGKNKTIRMHREIMKTPDSLVVDHIDHNTLNNQKSNLRNCSSRENVMNRYVDMYGTKKPAFSKPVLNINNILIRWNTNNPDKKVTKAALAREFVINKLSKSQASALVFMLHAQNGFIRFIDYKLIKFLMTRFQITDMNQIIEQ